MSGLNPGPRLLPHALDWLGPDLDLGPRPRHWAWAAHTASEGNVFRNLFGMIFDGLLKASTGLIMPYNAL